MKITFLGTSSGAPSRTRNMTSLALQLPQRPVLWLFDCGEGTQHQILRSPLKLSQMDRIFITHLHGDHLFGLPGLLASRSLQNGGETAVTLYGPQGLSDFLRGVLESSRTRLGYPISVERVHPGTVYEDAHFQVLCAPMKHGVEAYGYAIVEKDQPGHFDVERAQQLGIPAGPIYGQLKRGETVTLTDGRVIEGAGLCGPTLKGRKVVFCGDTTFTPNAVRLAQGADLLIHEATYIQEDLALAERANHSTAIMAAEVARQAGVKRLVLTHFSLRYESEGGATLEDLLAQARGVFPNTTLAYDFMSIEVFREEGRDRQGRGKR